MKCKNGNPANYFLNNQFICTGPCKTCYIVNLFGHANRQNNRRTMKNICQIIKQKNGIVKKYYQQLLVLYKKSIEILIKEKEYFEELMTKKQQNIDYYSEMMIEMIEKRTGKMLEYPELKIKAIFNGYLDYQKQIKRQLEQMKILLTDFCLEGRKIWLSNKIKGLNEIQIINELKSNTTQHLSKIPDLQISKIKDISQLKNLIVNQKSQHLLLPITYHSPNIQKILFSPPYSINETYPIFSNILQMFPNLTYLQIEWHPKFNNCTFSLPNLKQLVLKQQTQKHQNNKSLILHQFNFQNLLNLQKLTIKSINQLSFSFVSSLKKIPKLSHLKLQCRIQRKEEYGLKQFQNLTYLSLHFSYTSFLQQFKQQILEIPNLKSLDISLTNKEIYFTDIFCPENIIDINISNILKPNKNQLKKCLNIQKFIAFDSLFEQNVTIDIISNFKNLKVLDIGLSNVFQSRLDDQKLSFKQIQYICENNKHLIQLRLDNHNICNKSVQLISKTFHSLELFSINQSKISQSGCYYLSKMKNLKVLVLGSDKNPRAFKLINNLKSLQKLKLTNKKDKLFTIKNKLINQNILINKTKINDLPKTNVFEKQLQCFQPMKIEIQMHKRELFNNSINLLNFFDFDENKQWPMKEIQYSYEKYLYTQEGFKK